MNATDTVPNPNSPLEIVKSILVIPIVVAIVMGIGFGLARLAERKAAASGKPDVQPSNVAADGSIELPMQFGLITGQIVYHPPTLTNWRHTDDAILWHFPLEPGRYAVELNYACDPTNAGSTVQIQVGDSTMIVKVESTGASAMYKNFRAGEVNIPDQEWYNLRMTATEIANKTVMNLRGVKLIPIKKSE